MSELALFKYDRATGQVYDADGNMIGTWMGARPFESNTAINKIDNVNQILQLKSAGFTADEILKLLAGTN